MLTDTTADLPEGKVCTKCGVWKPLDSYYRADKGKYGRRTRCVTCYADDCRERNARPEVKARRRIVSREYSQRPENRERNRASVRRYARTDKGRTLINQRNAARAAARRADGRIPTGWRKARLSAQRNRCCYCGEPFTADRRPTIEHLLPVSQGGDNSIGNLALACKNCNSGRGNRAIPAPVQTTMF